MSSPGLAWQACLKKQIELELLTDIDLLLMVEKGIMSKKMSATQYIDMLK